MGNTTRRLDSIVYRYCFAGSLHYWAAAASFARESVNIPQIVNLPDISFPFSDFESSSCNYLIASYFLFQKPRFLEKRRENCVVRANKLAYSPYALLLRTWKGCKCRGWRGLSPKNDGIFSTASHFKIGGDKRSVCWKTRFSRKNCSVKSSAGILSNLIGRFRTNYLMRCYFTLKAFEFRK